MIARPRPGILAGFHVSIAGGIEKAVARAVDRGCTAFQIFTSSPSQWARRPLDKAESEAFRTAAAQAGIQKYFVHAIYLLNLASADEGLRAKSVSVLGEELVRADLLGASGVIFHLGSVGAGGDCSEGIRRVASSLEAARAASGRELPLVLENSAGAGGTIGAEPAHLEAIISKAGRAEPMAICLDTAHAFAAGIPIHTAAGLDELMARPFMDRRLAVLHTNDSLGGAGSRRDRHWHLGDGEIGMSALRRIVRHSRIRNLPMIMETPGTLDDDRRNMKTLITILGLSKNPAL
jgi:deoxyribonuclease-4